MKNGIAQPCSTRIIHFVFRMFSSGHALEFSRAFFLMSEIGARWSTDDTMAADGAR